MYHTKQEASNSTIQFIVKALTYIMTGISVPFILGDVSMIASSLDLSFLLPFIFAIIIFITKLTNIVGLYFSFSNSLRHIGNVMVSICYVIMLVNFMVITLQLIQYSKNIIFALQNLFVIYYGLIVFTDTLALINIYISTNQMYFPVKQYANYERTIQMMHIYGNNY